MSANYREILICRLCLTINKQFNAIDDIKREAIGILFLKLNIEISKNAIICEECLEKMNASINFKFVCVDTEELLTCFADDRKITKFELKDIYDDDDDKESEIKKDFNICRFCINPKDLNNFAPLETLMEESTFKKMLLDYMPEMDFNIIKNPIICSTCRDHLESYFKFIRICLDVEEKIKMYCQKTGTDNKELDLYNVWFHYSFKGNLKYSDNFRISMTSQNSTTIEDTEDVHSKACRKSVKVEDLDIKDEGGIFIVNTNETILESVSDQHYSIIYPNKETDEERASDRNFLKTGNEMLELCSEVLDKRKVCDKQKIFKSHKVNRYMCKFCTFKTKLQQDLKIHMKIHGDTLKAKLKSNMKKKFERKQILLFAVPLCN